MLNKGLGAEGICAIIKACGEARVAILQFGELCIWMDGPVAREALNPAPRTTSPHHPEAAISVQQKKAEEKALVQAELALKSDEAAELLLTDPARFEELLLQGALDDDERPIDTDEA